MTVYRAEELDIWIGKYDYAETYEHAIRNAFLTLCDIEEEIEGVYFEKDL